MKHIENKQEFYRLSRSRQLGNCLQQWSWAEFVSIMRTCPEDLPEVVGVRHVRQAFTKQAVSGLMTRGQALSYGHGVPDACCSILIDEGAVHDNLTLQGEIMATENGLYTRTSTLQVHQRVLWQIDQNGLNDIIPDRWPHNWRTLSPKQIAGTMPVVQHHFGLQATLLLKRYMDDMSWTAINDILNEYHYPIVEFACFRRPLGLLGWNSVIWEVRTRY